MVNKYKKLVIIIIAIFTTLIFTNIKTYAIVNDNNRNFKRITIENGLSQGSVFTIMQDSKGYMWIGTNDGLNKYNGSKFNIYKYTDNDENSISANGIVDIKEDKEGNIWVGTVAGLNKIDPVTNKITRYLPNENGCNISNHRIRAIMIGKNGEILVATNDGLNKYERITDNFIRIYNSDDDNYSLSHQEIYSLAEDYNGDYWIGTRKGLNRIDKKTGKVQRYFVDANDDNSISENFIYSLYADNSENLWIGTFYGGLNKLNLKTGTIEKYMIGDGSRLPGALIKDILVDSRGYLWVGTDFGFAKLNEENNTFITYKSSKYNSGSVISDNILSLYEDRTGAIWIGTDEGISLFNPENLFNYYKSDPFDNNSLTSDSVTGIYEDNDGLLWVGTFVDGLNIIDRQRNKITRVDSKSDYDGELRVSDNLIRKITGIDNEIWIATQEGLNKYNKDTGEMVIYGVQENFGCVDIKSLHIDKDGTLWIGTIDGLYTFDRKETFTDYTEVLKASGIEVLDFNDIYEDEEGLIWLGSSRENGLIRLNKETKEIKRYNNFNKNKGYSLILSINSDKEDNLWLGTDSGLVKFNKNTEEHIKYTEEDNLPNNFIYGILFEDDENLWVSTNYGISKLIIKEERFINYDSTDGIQGNEFNQYSYFKSKSGELFFGGTNGLTSFIPENIREKDVTMPVEFESIYSNFGEVEIEKEISLGYKNNQLKFDFFMADYTDTRKIKYAYKLIGLDKQWTISEEGNSAYYSNLKPGKYEFQVAGRSSSGEWSNSTVVKLNIANPPWKTPIAYIIYFLLTIFSIYIIWDRVRLLDTLVKQRTIELNNKLKENEELYSKLLSHEKYKNNYFINLSHELRTPLNVISSTENLIESLNKQNKEIPKEKMTYYMKTIKKNCGRLVNLIDNILHTSKIEAGSYKLNIKENDIVYLVEEVALSMKELVEEKGIELVVDPFVEEKVIQCDALEVERVIINLISNAVKFTDEGGSIEVYIWEFGDFVKISVKDNGIGIDSKNLEFIFDRFSQEYSRTSEEYGGSGLGLTLSRQLIELHGGKLWVESELGKGSEFIIKLPVKQELEPSFKIK